jgi:uncharacterized protein
MDAPRKRGQTSSHPLIARSAGDDSANIDDMYKVSFTAVEQAFNIAGAALSVAESHGCLAGALCVHPGYSLENWLEEVLPDTALTESTPQTTALREPLSTVFDDTLHALRSDEMAFIPLLPNDESPLAARTEALAQWSQGFLYGFGTSARAHEQAALGDVAEVLRDIAEIARASSQGLSGGEEEEQAYTELVEYMRAGAQLIHDELAADRELRHKRPIH